MNKTVSHSLEETAQIAKEWLEKVSTKHTSDRKALIVGLSGDLGAGKTAFTKAVAKELGITEEVTSPTFVIMKTYLTTHSTWKRLVHIDAYRLETPEEVPVLGFDSLASDSRTIILVEWPEHIAKALDIAEPPLYIRFRVPEGASAHMREIEFS